MLTILFVIVVSTPIYGMWRTEQSALLEGDLTVQNPVRLKFPRFQIGDSCAVIGWNDGVPLILFKDADIRFSLSPQGTTEITTTVEDREGHRIVEVNENHWAIYEGAGDKNYTSEALEVLDKGGHVVLQIRLLPDRAALWGEWHNEFDQAAQITECTNRDKPGSMRACIALFGPAFPEKTSKVHIEKLFQYPSKDHWGEFRKKH
jgi:hypothetical protein